MLFCGRNWPLGLTRNTEVFDNPVFFFVSVFNSVTVYADLGIKEFRVAYNVALSSYMAWFVRGLADQSIMQLPGTFSMKQQTAPHTHLCIYISAIRENGT